MMMGCWNVAGSVMVAGTVSLSAAPTCGGRFCMSLLIGLTSEDDDQLREKFSAGSGSGRSDGGSIS